MMSADWQPHKTGREAEEDELAERVLRVGYLETAVVPDAFGHR